ncbi:MAG: spore germination protein [Bacilli bacterium]|nr:spore germination protein [Bacilli bacterium]
MDFISLNEKIQTKLGYSKSYDVGLREINVLEKKVNLYFLTGLIDSLQVIEIVKGILKIPRNKKFVDDLIKENLAHHSLTDIKEFQDIILNILNGMVVIVIEDVAGAISIDVRNYPNRSISEPDMEKVIRGSHDGFNENFHQNIQLVRRRIKDSRLRNELFFIGDDSPAYVCLTYIDGVCEEDLLNDVRKRLNDVKTSHLIMSDKALEEMIIKQKKFNAYPLVRYTERADTVSVHLYQGMFALFVDTSPSVILAPCTLFDHMQHLEEYRQSPISGTYLRLVRFFGIAIALFLTPVWLVLVRNDWFFGILEILRPGSDARLGIFMQVLAAEVGVEFLRMASIHTPSSLSTAMGLIAGILIGEMAVSMGVFETQTVLLVALSAIGTYVTPSYELGLANKITKLVFIFSILLFNFWGFVGAFLVWLIYLGRIKSFKKPYLYPVYPFNFKRFLKTIIRYPYSRKNFRND